MIQDVLNIVGDLPSITLQQLGAVDFDSRIDTKLVFHQDKLSEFLNVLKDDLVVLELNERRIFEYENLYCDNVEFNFFRKHHSGFGNRSKVRVRKYGESGPFFFEVKNKTNKGKTVKYRVPINSFAGFENRETTHILEEQTGFSFENLPQRTGVNYKRITFSNTNFTEKLTVDFEMEAKNDSNKFEFSNLVVVEVKQVQYSSRSPFIMALKELKIYKTSFSKYCTSVAFLNSGLKKNRFLPILKNVNKIARA